MNRREFLSLCGGLIAMVFWPNWAWAADQSLASGDAILTLTSPAPGNSGLRLVLKGDHGTGREFRTAEPLALEVVDAAGATNRFSSGYSDIVRTGAALRCTGEIRSPAESVFHFTDLYTPGPATNSFALKREVAVSSPASRDAGFATRFSLSAAWPTPLREHEFFIPGIWYRDNEHVPPRALAANLTDDHFIIREDRMPLPLVMMRDRNTGATITLIHSRPEGGDLPGRLKVIGPTSAPKPMPSGRR